MLLPLLFLLALPLFVYYVLSPIQVRFTLKQPSVPRLTALAEADLPPGARPQLGRHTAALRGLGFDAPLYFSTESMHGASVAFFVNRARGDTVVVGTMRDIAWVEFQADFSDGMAIVTGNTPFPAVFAEDSLHRVWRFPDVRDPAALYSLHRARIVQAARASRGTPVVVVPAPGSELPFLVSGIAAPIEHQARLGMQWLDGDVYRPTLGGAFRMVWRMAPPSAWYYRRQLRRESAARAAELAPVRLPDTPVCRVEIAPAPRAPGAATQTGGDLPTLEELSTAMAREQPRANRTAWITVAALLVGGIGPLFLVTYAQPGSPLRIAGVILSLALVVGISWLLPRWHHARWRRLGLICPGCAQPLLGDRSAFVANTGLCQHCGSIVGLAAPAG